VSRSRLLQLALPLVKEYGFTRETLARSALEWPQQPHTQPLSESAVSTLFGEGDAARRTLIGAWLEEGQIQMRAQPVSNVKDALNNRLRYNEPVLPLLPEAFALLASPKYGLPPFDVRPALRHATSIADEACHLANDASTGTSWYARRATLAAIYTAAGKHFSKLHQLTSPRSAPDFLESLLTTANETELFSRYIMKSWAGIIKSSGVF
ncbi:hypothetical protein HETIRDRAFT_55120, partial [Heterobasidion irregulare TC 32-1]